MFPASRVQSRFNYLVLLKSSNMCTPIQLKSPKRKPISTCTHFTMHQAAAVAQAAHAATGLGSLSGGFRVKGRSYKYPHIHVGCLLLTIMGYA